MLRNVSYNYKTVREELEACVGKSFSMVKRLKLGGVGSRRMVIIDGSDEIKELLAFDKYTNYCYMEIRPFGLVIFFRSRLETYAMAVNYTNLTLLWEKEVLTVQSPEYFIKMVPLKRDNPDYAFTEKVKNLQNLFQNP